MTCAQLSGTCRLCQNDRSLLKSHVASKFLWRSSGVTGHRRSFSARSTSHPHLSERNRQDSFKEHLLCEDCEQQFGRYEGYASRMLFGRKSPVIQRPVGHYIWTGLDYRKLKLFQMLILWRMGISSHPYYAHVKLGKHEERLRTMLCAEDPGEPWRYGCIATLLTHARKPVAGFFAQPERIKLWGHSCYRLVLAGMHWFSFVSSHKPSNITCQLFLNPSGTWVLFQGEIFDFPYLRAQVMDLRRQHEET
jgi:hypothetical protein